MPSGAASTIAVLRTKRVMCPGRCTPGRAQSANPTFSDIPINAPGGRIEKTVRVFVLGFDVNQRAINQLETVAREGNTGSVYSGGDPASLQAAFSRILTEAIPVEECNGEDDDCDTRIDEGVLNSCGRCGSDPQEICNGR